MTKNILLGVFTLSLFFSGALALAQTTTNATSPNTAPTISFPIEELGGCNSKDACRIYCDVVENREACYTFALKHALMRKDEVEKAREINNAVGPSGCRGRDCLLYCKDPTNEVECRAFAQMHNILKPIASSTLRMASTTREKIGTSTLPGEAATRAKIVQLLKTTPGPGGCTTPDACKKYCADSTHTLVCLQFAKDNGLMKPDEILRGESFVRMRDGEGTTTGSTTLKRPPLKPELHSTSTLLQKPRLPLGTTTQGLKADLKAGSTTKPGEFKPPFPGNNSGAPGVDKTKPPYHCTPAQEEEGACDPENLPGAKQNSNEGLGGAVINAFRGVLNYFGF